MTISPDYEIYCPVCENDMPHRLLAADTQVSEDVPFAGFIQASIESEQDAVYRCPGCSMITVTNPIVGRTHDPD